MSDRIFNVLFLCTGNSARSIFAEALLNQMGAGRFKAHSAGSHPAGKVNPFAVDLLREHKIATGDLRSKSWDEFAAPGAPKMDLVFTVCDSAASEVCPVWPGQPITAHWGVPDPAAVEGTDREKRKAFEAAFRVLGVRIRLLVSLRIESLNRLALEQELGAIGKAGLPPSGRKPPG